MNITIEKMKKLAGAKREDKSIDYDCCIAVLDRGFVYVGQCREFEGKLHITNARNIRKWGTTKGLGELIEGPLSLTRLDLVGTVIAPIRAVIHLIKCNRSW